MQVCSLHLYYKSISQDKQSKFPLHFLEKENCLCRFVWGNYHPYPIIIIIIIIFRGSVVEILTAYLVFILFYFIVFKQLKETFEF